MDGNAFLKKHGITLRQKPLITNRDNPTYFHGLPPYPKAVYVDEIADVRHLPYREVDMFLCSYLTWYGDDVFGKSQRVKRFIATMHYALRYKKSRSNLHISLFRETARCLRPNGLLLVEGISEHDLPIARACGFRLIHEDTTQDAVYLALFQLKK